MKRLAILCDLVEENWASMDLVADKLWENLESGHRSEFRSEHIRPSMRRRFTAVPLLKGSAFALNADRLLNRFHDYPGYLKTRISDFDLFHICDHSYAQLVHGLPPERTGVFLHDTDAFRCLLEPEKVKRSAPFRMMMRHVLDGLQKAALVFYSTPGVRSRIEKSGLVDPARLVHAPYGVSAAFSPEPAPGESPASLPPSLQDAPFLLHVGLCIPRKRIDVLLDVFAKLRARRPGLRLLQIGGDWSPAQLSQIRRLGIGRWVTQLSRRKGEGPPDEASLAPIYRRAQAVLIPSELEGFGLPVVEALACGRPVVASDIPALRFTGGDAALFVPVGDVPAWVETVSGLLDDPSRAPSLAARLAQARRFTWAGHARIVSQAYRRLSGDSPAAPPPRGLSPAVSAPRKGPDRRLRVLHVGKFYPPHRGGMESHLELLCRGLQRWVDVEVLVANDARHDSTESQGGVRVRRLGTLFSAASTPICPGMFGALRDTAADLVHIHLPNPIATLARLAGGARQPMVATYHGDIVRQRFLGLIHEPFQRRILERCAAVIATSPRYIETSPVLRRCKSLCRAIPLSIPFDAYQEQDERAVAGVLRSHGPRLVLAVGRLIYYKGFDILIDAMSEVQGRLVIIGEGPLRGPLQRRIRAAGLEERVALLGDIDDLRPYYQAAAVFVLPSVYRAEAFGIVQLEAMACGTPVVNTDLDTGVPFVSPHGVTGLTVPPGDARSLAGAINRLLDDDALRERLGEAGRRRVRERFNVDTMVQDTLRLYGEVTGRAFPPA